MYTLIDMLNGNHDDTINPTMQRDDRFVLLSWRNIRNNDVTMLDGKVLTYMAILAVGLPLLVMM